MRFVFRFVLASSAVLVACGQRERNDEVDAEVGITSEPSPGDGDGDRGGDGDGGDGDGEDVDIDDGEPGEDGGPKFDTLTEIDLAPKDCTQCGLAIASMQSGAFSVTDEHVFATALLAGQIVYALGNYGDGRFIAAADSSLPFNEVTDCPVHAWLAGTAQTPAILRFGWTKDDGPLVFEVDATVSGVHLPPKYIGDPKLLRQDFDIVIYMEAASQHDKGDEPSDIEMQTLLDYVAIYAGGLYIVSEFAELDSDQYLSQADLDSINRVMLPLGVEALRVSLNWGAVVGTIEFTCFPTPVG